MKLENSANFQSELSPEPMLIYHKKMSYGIHLRATEGDEIGKFS